MKATTALFATSAILVGTSASSAVLVGGTINGLNTADGSPSPAGSKTIAIIDVDGDGVSGFDLGNWDGSSFLPDSDDVIVTDGLSGNGAWNEATGDDVGTNEDFGTNILVVPTSRYQFDLVDPNSPTVVGAGDAVYLFHFPGLDINASEPGAGQDFGVTLLGELDAVGGVNFFLLTGQEDFRASNTTVPEPGSLALLGLGGLSMLRRRR